MFPLEAGLHLTLEIEAQRVARVAVNSTRLVQAARMLAGRSPAHVTAILPSIFALCGTAQGLAGACAIENAAGIAPPPSQLRARRLLILVETMVEHASAIVRDWPVLLERDADIATLKTLRPMLAAARRALYPDGDWMRPGGGRLAIDRRGLAEVMNHLKALVSRIEDRDAEAAALLRHVERAGLAGFGACEIHPMPPQGPPDLAERLETDHDGSYVARPDFGGKVIESNALTRRFDHPAVARERERHGTGLLARFAARLADVAESLREAEDLVQDLADHRAAAADIRISGYGLGRIDAARGLLAHRVELENGVVSRYQILAPTEWNFHPRGPLCQALLDREAGPHLEHGTRLLVAALDPCVACRVEVTRNA
jgi:coenzyme F420-reducing hydrogenase alpha subunit